MNKQPREDGPALQKLFANLDGPSMRPAPMPAEFAAQIGAGRVATAAEIGVPVDNLDASGAFAPIGAGEVVDLTGQSVQDIAMPGDSEGDVESFGVVNYPQALHQAGEAATQIVKNMVDSEFAQGNPRNIPEPIIGWYTMTMGYQLCMLEATEQSYAARKDHAEQFAHARKVFERNDGAYADAVKEEVAYLVAHRHIPAALQGEDLTYGGVLK